MEEHYESGYDEDSGGGLDLKVLVFYGIGRSRYLVAFFLILGIGAGLVLAAAKPNTYSSIARLHFLAGKREGLTPEILAGVDDTWAPSIGVNDEIVLLQDLEIYEKVAQELGVRRVLEPPDPSAKDTPQTPPHVRLLHSIQKFLNASASKDNCADEHSERCIRLAGIALKDQTKFSALPRSSVIEVHHEATSPERAQEFAQALVEAFVERHRNIFSATSHAEETKEEMLEAYDRLQESTEHYREHRKLCGFQSLGEETTEIRKEIAEVQTELRKDRTRRSQVVGQLEEYEKYLAEIPKTLEEVTEAIYDSNPEYEYVKQEIFRRQLDLSLVEEEAVIADRERRRDLIERQLERLNEQLSQMDPLIELKPEKVRAVPNPEYFEYKRKVDDLVAEDSGLGLSIQEAEKSLRQLLEQLDLAGECEKHHDYWERKVADAEQDHSELKDVYYQLRSLSNLDAEGESNLRIYQAALLPLEKSGPQRSKTVLMGLMGGLALGVGFAVLRQLMERRVRYARTLESRLGLTVLAVVPEAAGLRKLARRRAAANA